MPAITFKKESKESYAIRINCQKVGVIAKKDSSDFTIKLFIKKKIKEQGSNIGKWHNIELVLPDVFKTSIEAKDYFFNNYEKVFSKYTFNLAA